MINNVKRCIPPIFINIFNVDSEIKSEQLLQFYIDCSVKEVIRNYHKKGNYDFVFST
jgi:hypothetical protein